ncbi:hypothetical protein QTI66_06700 [Variovorax sp. J22R133]|uniref:hypothetical protein n=1 Tax=Variovorax brevis TaxID=3053503 RepID=UPI002577A423|nr:hypothetical protein [Variovorax sp. J22R133]MDM0111833.1 hypothetical protein [Variovorax sp. J22R133]
MPMFLRLPTLLALSALSMSALAAAPAARAPVNDFPTVDRVLYVQECMRAHPGPQFEMINKCSCTLDALATTVKYNEYVTMSTIVKAMTIGGERGGAIRDVPSYEPQVKRYKEQVSKAEKGCFIGADSAK